MRTWPLRCLQGVLLTASSCCVAARSLVQTPAGRREGKSLRVGDSLWAVELPSRARVEARISAIRSAQRRCLELRWRGGSLECTHDHPIYSPERDAYLPASAWAEGAVRALLVWDADRDEASVHSVTETRKLSALHEVLDIAVDAAQHNFIAGDTLVHNKSDGYRVTKSVEDQVTMLAGVEARTFRVRVCHAGAEPGLVYFVLYASTRVVEAAGDSMALETYLIADDEPTPGNGYGNKVFLEIPEDLEFVSDVYGAAAEYGKVCTPGASLRFARSDGLLDGVVGVDWRIDAHVDAPAGEALDEDKVTIVIDEDE